MTGLSEFTLRGWEYRYGAFRPGRTSTGRRIYSPKDLQKALLLRELVKREHKISDIANLHISLLRNLLGESRVDIDIPVPRYESEIQQILTNVSINAWEVVESVLLKTVYSSKPMVAISYLLVPLLQALSRGVDQKKFTIAQEHILSALIRQCLFNLINSKVTSKKSRMVIAAPEGDFHELGILAAHVIVSNFHIRSLYLGPNTPKNELCETAVQFGATHLLLGVTLSKAEGAKEDFFSYLHYLDRNLPRSIVFWFGGRNAELIHLKRECRNFLSLDELHSYMSVHLDD